MRGWFFGVFAAACLSGCAAPQESTGQQADDAACTAQADALYTAETPDLQARTSQAGLRYGSPTQVFGAEQLGALHDRDSALQNCESNGNNETRGVLNTPPVPPQIVNTPAPGASP